MKPLILDFKIEKTEDPSLAPYTYSFADSMSMIKVDGELRPFIDNECHSLELQTKTKTHRETDDQPHNLELGTKTETRRERDDLHNTLLELMSKTFTSRERDDK